MNMKSEELKDFFISDFSKEIYELTYKFDKYDKNIYDTFRRVAKNLASIEKDKEYWEGKFYELLLDFKFLPGGRILSNAGIDNLKTTYINCFVSGFRGESIDSMESIMDELKRQAVILKSEGGYGVNIDALRPRGSYVRGIANNTPGPIKFLEIWDKQADVITAGVLDSEYREDKKKKIRKGAQMVTMSVWHPDIEEFIIAKRVPGRLNKFNMSVLISDEFMRAVEKDMDWELIFPDYMADKEKYDKEWDGNINKWIANGGKIKVYKIIKARELYNKIMENTYNYNEPGVLFIDNINKNNNLWYCEYINATNPCGEQVLPIGGVCLLGSFNLTQFIDLKNKDWDYEKLKKYIPIAVRMLDNVNDITYVPLQENYENLRNKRRIGMGVMGYGSALAILGIKYGSEEALKKTEDFFRFYVREVYMASIELSKEKGPFKLFDYDKYIKSQYILRNFSNDEEFFELLKKYGIRNSHLISIQPTGNTSILANNVSGGIEPIFLFEYKRSYIISYIPEGLEMPKNYNFDTMYAEELNGWRWEKEGIDNVLIKEHNGDIYKIDKNRGLTREVIVKDYAKYILENLNLWDENAEYACTAIKGLDVDAHIKTLNTVAKYVDSAISKTINIPNDYNFEDFKNVYYNAWKLGYIKGLTTYREGTTANVLKSLNNENNKNNNYTKRPKELDADVYIISVYDKKIKESVKWIVMVGLLNNRPYEVFVLKDNGLIIKGKGKIIKNKGKHYSFVNDNIIIDNLLDYFERDEEEAVTRLVSLALRNNIDIKLIIEQLLKSEGTINSFSKAIARCLKKYINMEENNNLENNELKKCPECSKNALKIENGCYICIQCGYSKCI